MTASPGPAIAGTVSDDTRRSGPTRIVRAILDWCRTQGVTRVTLHASEEGRGIYERLGFSQTNEMRLELP